MELILATQEFEIAGISYPGFPIILNGRMEGEVAANAFLRHHLLHRGRVQSRKSWRTLAQHLYDYFSYLETYGLDWRERRIDGRPSRLAMYRDYCLQGCRLSPRTVNQRLSTVVQFYRYSHQTGQVLDMPFDMEDAAVVANGRLRRFSRPDVMLRTGRASVKYLAQHEVQALLRATKNPTHRLMMRMGLQVGLRREEIATFPVAYVGDPKTWPRASMLLRVEIDPNDGSGMRTKGGKARQIYIPRSLMADLWAYVLHIRPRLESKSAPAPRALFLTETGGAWSSDGKGILSIVRAAGKKVGLKTWPHMLRHTYATHILHDLQGKNIGVEPLVFLQRQLGHSSISTTLVYAHLIGDVVDKVVTSYDQEVTAWSSE